MVRRGRRMWVGRQADSRVASHRLAVALFCALALFFIAGSLLWSLPVNAAATPGDFYGVDSRVFANALADTPTSTDTPAPTPTDTPAPTATNTPAATATATATPSNPYALNVTGAASAAGWPQRYSNWCGIATVALVANYLGNGVSQSAIYSMLNSQQNESMWGYPPQSSSYYGPYLAADISGDFGTDPRSLAEGMTLATGRLYHVKVGLGGAWDTTIHIVDDLLISRQPISVFVDHGMHSVIVSGVDATGDPLANPNNITAIHVWDPGGGVNSVGIQVKQEMVVKKSDWLSGTISWSGASYFKYPYAANVFGGKALDPDPAVGPYAYVPSQVNHLWVGHNVYISPLASGDAAGLSPDWELNQNGVLIAGLPGGTWPNLPDGYTGSSIPMPSNPPPPPPPVKPPVIAPKKAALPPPRPTPTPRATATSTALPTATSLPTAAPTATARPAVCAPLNCAMSAMQSDAGLLVISLLLLLMTAVWFPAAILVARARAARMQWSKEKMLQQLAASDLAASDAPTLAELLANDAAPDDLPTAPLEAIPAGTGDVSSDAPADVANVMPIDATHELSGMSDGTSTSEATSDADATTLSP